MLQRVLSSRQVTGLGMTLSRLLPPLIGYALAGLIAALINRFQPAVYWIVLFNLRQVVGPGVSKEELHRLVRQVFRNTARNNYDLWRLVSRGPEALRAAVTIPPYARAYFTQLQERGRGTIIVGTHTGNFDLGVLALALFLPESQVLSLATQPAEGFALMDRMRTKFGVYVTPINLPALREAMKRLKAGGVVVTGVDRPVGDETPSVEFFGQPAPLPAGHVRLALKTDAAILVASPHCDKAGHTVFRFSPPLEMEKTGDLDADLRANLRRVTGWLEHFIREQPEQWAMFVPVWPGQRPS
jgi:KDO2-lipid IV(A) lauroyltransferase